MEHTPLDTSTLSAAAQKALAPGPTRMIAARGMVPLARPAELAAVLYQLALDGDQAIAAAAKATALALPDKVMTGVLADATTDARVLDWLVPRCAQAPALGDALITAPAVSDETIAELAARADSRTVEWIATNEQLLLRAPALIAALYGNPRASMSTVDRAVELAIRNGVRVDGIAAWDEIAKLLSSGVRDGIDDDSAFAQALVGVSEMDDPSLTQGDAEALELGPDGELIQRPAPEVDQKKVPIDKLSTVAKIRLATLGNSFARGILVRDRQKLVADAAIRSPGVTDIEAARYAANAQLSDDIIRYISQRRDWTRLYSIKIHLVMNPKTPLPEAARMLPHLRDKDLKNVAKSKGVPSAVAAQARKLISQRTSGGKR